jgi:leucyl-tRNA synthetase
MILAFSYRDENRRYYGPDEVEERDGAWFAKGSDTRLEVQIEKMSKSRKNVFDPDDVVDRYGADTLRMYEMFMGPLEVVKPWQTSGCEGIHRFLSRVWRLFVDQKTGALRPFGETSPAVRRALHVAIKEVTEGIDALRFNTPISRMMECVNAMDGRLPAREDAEKLLLVLSPYAPHLAEELWRRLGHPESLAHEPWPAWDEAYILEESVEMAVQVMGKLRGKVLVPRDATREQVLEEARASPNVTRWLEGKSVVKEVFVPGRLVNFVVR